MNIALGKLIVIEGLDGSGKNTQTKLLSEYLQKNGQKASHISFPDYNQPSSTLVRMYLNSEFGSDPNDVNAYAASSFYAVDRFASFKKFWQKEYFEGHHILCDRYTTSNAIYQMCKLPKASWGSFLDWLCDFEYEKLKLPKPDKVIYLSVPLEISQKLLNQRYSGDENKKDLHEANLKFLKSCKEAADYVAEKQNWEQIYCFESGSMKSIAQIHAEIVGILNKGD